jgi:hypothetical protein
MFISFVVIENRNREEIIEYSLHRRVVYATRETKRCAQDIYDAENLYLLHRCSTRWLRLRNHWSWFQRRVLPISTSTWPLWISYCRSQHGQCCCLQPLFLILKTRIVHCLYPPSSHDHLLPSLNTESFSQTRTANVEWCIPERKWSLSSLISSIVDDLWLARSKHSIIMQTTLAIHSARL